MKAQISLSVRSFLHMFNICTPMQLKKNSYFASLSETTKAADILQMVNNFFAKQDFFNWKKNIGRNIGSLCTDGAPAMLGKTSGSPLC